MAITFGGAGLWWFKDRAQLDELVDEWNQDQKQRKASGRAPQGTDGLIIAAPADLESPPPWASQPNGPITSIFMFLFTFPIQISLLMFKVIKGIFAKIPVIGPIYVFLLGIQEAIMKRSFSFMEAMQIGVSTGFVSYLAVKLECIELSLLMIGVSTVLTFTSAFTKISHTKIGKAALEWDYLLCSYYHHHRPDPFLVAYVKSAFLFIPRLFGIGVEGERTLFNRLTSQAALISFLFLPFESLNAIFFGKGFSPIDFAVQTFLGVITSVILISMYAPAICGSLTRHKLLGEVTELRLSGGLSMVASVCGLYFGL